MSLEVPDGGCSVRAGVGEFTDRQAALMAFDRLMAEDSRERVLVCWGVSGQGKSVLLRHLADRAAGRHRCELIDLDGLASYDLAASGSADLDLAALVLDRVAYIVAHWEPSPGRHRLARYRRAVAKARHALNTATGTVTVEQTAFDGGLIYQSPVHVDTRVGAGAAQAAYRLALVDALADLVDGRELAGCALLIDTTERLRFIDDAVLEQGLGRPHESAGVGPWFVGQVLPALLEGAAGLRVVLAGRDDLDLPPKVSAVHLELTGWDSTHTALYLASCGLADLGLAPAVHRLCKGTPVWVSLVAELCLQARKSGQEIHATWLGNIARGRPAEEWLPQVLLVRLTPRQQEVVKAAAVLRTITEEAIDYLLASEEKLPYGWYRRLCEHSFIRASRDASGQISRRMHELVRTAILSYLIQEQPARLMAFNHAAAEYFVEHKLFLEEAYHRFAHGDYLISDKWLNELDAAIERYDWDSGLRLVEIITAPEQEFNLRNRNPWLLTIAEMRAGKISYYQDRLGEAKTLLTSALTRSRHINDRLNEALTLEVLGGVLIMDDMAEDAEGVLVEALAIFRQIEHLEGAANSLETLSRAQLMRGRYEDAEASAVEALSIFKQIGDSKSTATTLESLGRVLEAENRCGDAEQSLVEAYGLFREIGDRRGIAQTLESLGRVLVAEDRWGEAEQPLVEALRLFREIGDRRGIAATLDTLATMLIMDDRLVDAGNRIIESLGIFREIGDRRNTAVALSTLGEVFLHADPLSDAEDSLLEALEIFEYLGDQSGRANALESLAKVLVQGGRFAEAEVRLSDALAIFSRIRDEIGLGSSLESMGRVLVRTGRLPEAGRQLEKALDIFRQFDDQECMANVLRTQGELLIRAGRPADADDRLKSALYIYRQVGDRRSAADALELQARALVRLDRLEEAEARLDESASLYRQLADRRGQADVMLTRGEMFARRDRLIEAEGWFNEALIMYRQIESRLVGEATTLQSLGDMLVRVGRLTEAERQLNAALNISRQIGDQMGIAEALRLGRNSPPVG